MWGAAGDDWKALVMLGAAAEQGSAVAMHNAAFLLQRGRGYNGSDAAAVALELLLRAGAIEHQYGDGLVDAANLLLDADRQGFCRAYRQPDCCCFTCTLLTWRTGHLNIYKALCSAGLSMRNC